MLLTNLFIVPIELLLGSALGFFLSDSRKGLSLKDVGLSSIVFIVVNIIMTLINPQTYSQLFGTLIIGWLSIMGGLLIGELAKLKILDRIIHDFAKKDVQTAIAELIGSTNEWVSQQELNRQDQVKVQLSLTQEKLSQFADRTTHLHQNQDTIQRINLMSTLCQNYVEAARTICTEPDTNHKQAMLCQLNETGSALKTLSTDTLTYAEDEMKRAVTMVSPSKIVKIAMIGK